MPTLHVRNVPEELHRQIAQRARAEHRSLSAQVVALLQRGIQQPERPVLEVLDDIARRRFRPAATAPDSTALLRQDRER